MIGHSSLERSYRRWLACYPASFRAEHEEEMLTVLIHNAEPGRHRPRLGKAFDLVRHGFQARLGRLGDQVPGRWERDHAKVMFPIRIGIALWLCLISGWLIGYHRGEWWLLLLVSSIAAHLYIAYRIRPGSGRRAA